MKMANCIIARKIVFDKCPIPCRELMMPKPNQVYNSMLNCVLVIGNRSLHINSVLKYALEMVVPMVIRISEILQ